MFPDSSTNLIIATFRQGSLSISVDCQKQQTYCLRLHFLDFAVANLFMTLVVPVSHGSLYSSSESGCSTSIV